MQSQLKAEGLKQKAMKSEYLKSFTFCFCFKLSAFCLRLPTCLIFANIGLMYANCPVFYRLTLFYQIKTEKWNQQVK